MTSFTALVTRNLTTFFAGILIASPVAGFLPTRDLICPRTKRPTPGNTNSPVFRDRSASKDKSLATFFETPSFLAVFAADGNPVAILT